MKKLLLVVAVVFTIPVAFAQAQCWQQYVCGGGGCHWVTLCR